MTNLTKAIKTTLRSRKISKGREAYYLDFYPGIENPQTGKLIRRFTLGLYLFEKSKNKEEKAHNKTGKIELENLTVQIKNQILNKDYSFLGMKEENDFIQFCREEIRRKSKHAKLQTIKSDEVVINHVKKFRSKISMDEVNLKLLQDFRSYLFDHIDHVNTIVQYERKLFYFVVKAFDLNKIEKYISYRALDRIKKEQVVKEYLTDEELERLIRTPIQNNEIKRACLFSYYTCLRINQVLNLTTSDINKDDEDNIHLDFIIEKTGQHHKVPLSNDALYLLGNPKGDKIFNLNYNYHFLERIKVWAKDAKVDKKVSPHIFRRTGINFYANNHSIEIAQKIAGHMDIRTTQIYTNIFYSKIKDAIDKRESSLVDSYQ